jgi:hypothetical protein
MRANKRRTISKLSQTVRHSIFFYACIQGTYISARSKIFGKSTTPVLVELIVVVFCPIVVPTIAVGHWVGIAGHLDLCLILSHNDDGSGDSQSGFFIALTLSSVASFAVKVVVRIRGKEESRLEGRFSPVLLFHVTGKVEDAFFVYRA